MSDHPEAAPVAYAPTTQSARDLIATYGAKASGMTQRERSDMEQAIWQATRNDAPRSMYRKGWLAQILGTSHRGIEARNTLRINVGCEILWSAMDRGMALETAVRLYEAAKRRWAATGNANATLADHVAKVVAEYDDLPQARIAGGRVIKVKTRSLLDSVTAKPDEAKAPAEPPAAKSRPKTPVRPKDFWRQIREQVASYVAAKASTGPERDFDALWTEFEADMKTACASFLTRLDTRGRHARKANDASARGVTRRQLVAALRVLHIDPPSVGQPVDLVGVERQKRRLARLYHPDVHGGSEITRPQYEAVLNAFEKVREYAKSFDEQTKYTANQ